MLREKSVQRHLSNHSKEDFIWGWGCHYHNRYREYYDEVLQCGWQIGFNSKYSTLTPNIARASGTLQPKNRAVVRRCKIRENMRGMENSGEAHLRDVLLKMDQGDQISPEGLSKIRNLIGYQCDQILKRESELGWRILTKVT